MFGRGVWIILLLSLLKDFLVVIFPKIEFWGIVLAIAVLLQKSFILTFFLYFYLHNW